MTQSIVVSQRRLLQSGYLVWVGILLGGLRRASGSWLISWLGHLSYNITVLFVLSLIKQGCPLVARPRDYSDKVFRPPLPAHPEAHARIL